MYVLHYAPDNASLVVRLALEETGADYRTRLVHRGRQEQKSEAYRALCPTGLIPVLETGDGPIFETAAILLWLADRHGGIAPATDTPGRGAFLSWLFFLSNTLHSDLIQLFHPERYAGGDSNRHRALTQARVEGHLALVDAALAQRPDWCTPDAPGAVGCYLAPMIRWLALYPAECAMKPALDLYPSIRDIVMAMESRPATLRAAEAEGLGRAPFSKPTRPQPPEGSAT